MIRRGGRNASDDRKCRARSYFARRSGTLAVAALGFIFPAAVVQPAAAQVQLAQTAPLELCGYDGENPIWKPEGTCNSSKPNSGPGVSNPYQLKTLSNPPLAGGGSGSSGPTIPSSLAPKPAAPAPKPYVPPRPSNIKPTTQAKQGQSTGVNPSKLPAKPPPKPPAGSGKSPSPQPMFNPGNPVAQPQPMQNPSAAAQNNPNEVPNSLNPGPAPAGWKWVTPPPACNSAGICLNQPSYLVPDKTPVPAAKAPAPEEPKPTVAQPATTTTTTGSTATQAKTPQPSAGSKATSKTETKTQSSGGAKTETTKPATETKETAKAKAEKPATDKKDTGKQQEKADKPAAAGSNAPAVVKEDTSGGGQTNADEEAQRRAAEAEAARRRAERAAHERLVHETAKKARAASAERAKQKLQRENVQPIGGTNNAPAVQTDPYSAAAALIKELAGLQSPAVVVKHDPLNDPCQGALEQQCRENAKKLADEMERERQKLKRQAKKALDKEHKKKNDEIRKEKEKLKKELKKRRERAKKDKRYRDRKAREDKIKKREEKLRKRAEDLKKRADKIKERDKRYKTRDKILREDEQKLRRNGDPNCRSAECRQIRRWREDNYRDRNNLAKERGQFAKAAAQFSADARNLQRDKAALQRLEDRGYGMTKKEFKARQAKRLQHEAEAQKARVRKQFEQFKKNVQNLYKNGRLGDPDDQESARAQYRSFKKELEFLDKQVDGAKDRTLKAEADLYGLSNAYSEFKKAQKTAQQNPKSQTREDEADYWKRLLDQNLEDRKRVAGLSDEELRDRYSTYKEASDEIDRANRGLGGNFRAGDGKALKQYSELSKQYKKALDKFVGIDQTKPENQKRLAELSRDANAIKEKLDKLWPKAQADAFSKHVELFNEEFKANFPIGADGRIDRAAVEKNVQAVAQQQMEFVKVAGQLDLARKKFAAFQSQESAAKGTEFYTKQKTGLQDAIKQLEARQSGIIAGLGKMGIKGSLKNGQFQPEPATWAAGKYWDTARTSVKNFVEKVRETRKRVAKLTGKKATATEYKPPEKAGTAEDKELAAKRQQAVLQLRAEKARALYEAARAPLDASKNPTSLELEAHNLDRTEKRLEWLKAEHAAAPKWMTSFRKELERQTARYRKEVGTARKSFAEELGRESKRLQAERDALDEKMANERADAFREAMTQREEEKKIALLTARKVQLRSQAVQYKRLIATAPKGSEQRKTLETARKDVEFDLKDTDKELTALQKKSDRRREAERKKARTQPATAARHTAERKTTTASLGPAHGGKVGTPVAKKAAVRDEQVRTASERLEDPALDKTTKEYVDWLKSDILPGLEKSPVASGALPGLVVGLAKEIGEEKAKGVVKRVAGKIRKEGLEYSGIALADGIMEERARLLREAKQDAAADAAMLARANFLAGVLNPVASSGRRWTPTEAEKKVARKSLDRIVPKLRAEIERKARRDGGDSVKVLGDLAKLVGLRALPETDPPDIKPLAKEIGRRLEMVSETRGQWDAGRIKVVQDLIAALDQAARAAPAYAAEDRKRLGRLEAAGFRALGKAADRKIAASKGAKREAARGEKALAVLGEAKSLARAGDFKQSIDLLDRVKGSGPELQGARDAVLIETVDSIESRYGSLETGTREALGDLNKLVAQRDAALERLLAGTRDPRKAAAVATKLAAARERGGAPDAAIKALREGLKRSPKDLSLNGELLRLETLKEGEKVTADSVARLLETVPQDARLPAALLALGRLGQSGDVAQLKALAQVLKKADWVGEENRPAVDLQLKIADVSIIAGQESSAARDEALLKAANEAQRALGRIAGMDIRRKLAFGAAIERVRQEVTQAQRWRGWIELGQEEKTFTPVDGFDTVARAALAQGRYDIAGEALRLHAARIAGNRKKLKPLGVIRETRKAVRVLDLVRKRLLGSNISATDRARIETFLEKNAGPLVAEIDGNIKERSAALDRIAKETSDMAAFNRKAAAAMAELRALGQLRARAALAGVSEQERGKVLGKALGKAQADVQAQRDKMRRMFAKLGKAIIENPQFNATFRDELARLNSLRAVRDGIQDFGIDEFTHGPRTGGGIGFVQSNVLNPDTSRDVAILDVQKRIAGVRLTTGPSALKEMRRDLGNQRVGRGLREAQIVNEGFDRAANREPGKYASHWFEKLMIQADLAYFDRRRQELVREDPTRSVKEKEKLFSGLLAHESRLLKGVSAPENAFSELNQRLTGVGDDYRASAKDVDALIGQNQRDAMIDELRDARIKGDAQRAFEALVNLRDASLAGEIKAFVDYTHVGFTEVGPAQVYNLAIGGEATAKSLEFATAQAGRLNIALLRAAHNLPNQLDAADRELLERQGFIRDGKYVFPDDIKIETTKVASEFVKITRTGALGAVDRIVNAKEMAKLLATVALPGSLAARFGQTVATELEALGLARTLAGRAVASGVGLLAEGGAFTGLSRLAQTAIDPARMLNAEMWSGKALWTEYTHNLAVIGALKLKGLGQEGLLRLADKAAKAGLAGKVAGSALELVTKSGEALTEAELMTRLNGLLSNNAITRESFYENLVNIGMLRGVGKLTEGKAKESSRDSSREARRRIAGLLRETGREAPAEPPVAGRVGQTAESIAKYYDWVDSYHLPEQRLMTRFNGDWDAARTAYQKGKISAAEMKGLVELRKRVVDSLAAEIKGELGGDVQAFGSENLGSDYDISFVGKNAQLAVILFNARFKNRWGMAVDIGGTETGIKLDTNAYTGTEHANFRGGKKDVWFQDAFAHLAARKYLDDNAWMEHRQHLLDEVRPEDRADLVKALDWVEARSKEYRAAIEAQKKKIAAASDTRLSPKELQIAAENRLYEQTLYDIIQHKADFRWTANPAKRAALAQEIRNLQSKALYFAQEAYQTQAAIEHVVFTIQAAKRKITVDSLMARGPPKLSIPLTEAQGRESYLEQIANMLKEMNHHYAPEKLSSKAAKYFLRALDAAKIAGIDLTDFKPVVEATVEVEANRADLDKVKKILTARFGDGGGNHYLDLVRDATNRLSAELFGDKKGTVVDDQPRPGAPPAAAERVAMAPPGAPENVFPGPPAGRSDFAGDKTLVGTSPKNAPGAARTPATSDLPWLRQLWQQSQAKWRATSDPAVGRQLALLEDINDRRASLTDAERAIADRALQDFRRLVRYNRKAATLGDLHAFLQFNLHARADGITPAMLVADFVSYNGIKVTAPELAVATRSMVDVAKRALDRAEKKLARGTVADEQSAPPPLRVVGTPVKTPEGMPTVQKQELCNSCGVAAARSVIQRLIGRLFSEQSIINWSKLTKKGFLSGPLGAGGTWPKGMIEILRQVPGLIVKTPYGREFRQPGLDPTEPRTAGSGRRRSQDQVTLDEVAAELGKGAQVLAVVHYRVGANVGNNSLHWVIIEKVATGTIRNAKGEVVYKGRYVVVGDPAHGTSVAIPRADFLRHWHAASTISVAARPTAPHAPLFAWSGAEARPTGTTANGQRRQQTQRLTAAEILNRRPTQRLRPDELPSRRSTQRLTRDEILGRRSTERLPAVELPGEQTGTNQGNSTHNQPATASSSHDNGGSPAPTTRLAPPDLPPAATTRLSPPDLPPAESAGNIDIAKAAPDSTPPVRGPPAHAADIPTPGGFGASPAPNGFGMSPVGHGVSTPTVVEGGSGTSHASATATGEPIPPPPGMQQVDIESTPRYSGVEPGSISFKPPDSKEPIVLQAKGNFLGEGSFSIVYSKPGSRGLRGPDDLGLAYKFTRAGDASFKLDDVGRAPIERLEATHPGLVETPALHQRFYVRSQEWVIGEKQPGEKQLGGGYVSEVDVAPPAFKDLLRAEPGAKLDDPLIRAPDGSMTPAQLAAYKRGIRAINDEGYAVTDGHSGNFTFGKSAHPAGPDGLVLIIPDTGGIIPMKAGHGRTAVENARALQEAIHNPPPDIAAKYLSGLTGRQEFMQLLAKKFDDVVDWDALNKATGLELKSLGSPDVSQKNILPYNPEIGVTNPEIRGNGSSGDVASAAPSGPGSPPGGPAGEPTPLRSPDRRPAHPTGADINVAKVAPGSTPPVRGPPRAVPDPFAGADHSAANAAGPSHTPSASPQPAPEVSSVQVVGKSDDGKGFLIRRVSDGKEAVFPFGPGKRREGSSSLVLDSPSGMPRAPNEPRTVVKLTVASEAPVDRLGRNAIAEVNDPSVLQTPEVYREYPISDSFDFLGKTDKDFTGGVLLVVDEAPRSFADLEPGKGIKALDGKLTKGQLDALYRGKEALNEKGYAWGDDKGNNFTFKQVGKPGEDKWVLVVLDTGGVIPMKGGNAAAARALQRAIDNPTEKIRKSLDTKVGRYRHANNLAKEFDHLVDWERLQRETGRKFETLGDRTKPAALDYVFNPRVSYDHPEIGQYLDKLSRPGPSAGAPMAGKSGAER